jgi:hypothetical protein
LVEGFNVRFWKVERDQLHLVLFSLCDGL